MKMGFNEHWDIDADDTYFFANPEMIASSLKEVERYSLSKDIAAMSLDMWYSFYSGRHWTLGIVF